MAAGLTTLVLSNGQRLTVYDGVGDAVGAQKRCSLIGDAGSTSPFGFVVNSKCFIQDIICLTTAGGEYEILKDGQRTGKKIPTDARFAFDTVNRIAHVPHYGFYPGVKYGFMQTVVQS